MSTRRIIALPNGVRKWIFYGPEQSKREIVETVQLPRWSKYCEKNWLNSQGRTNQTPEQRIKRFLDDCAYLLQRDNPEGTLSTYKEMARSSTEIPVSSCPARYEHELYGSGSGKADLNEEAAFGMLLEQLEESAKSYAGRKPRKEKARELTRFEKIERVKCLYPNCGIDILEVDTENIFELRGREYQIDETAEQYQPKRTREGLLYDMDRVVVVTDADGGLHIYDQKFDAIDNALIHLRDEDCNDQCRPE